MAVRQRALAALAAGALAVPLIASPALAGHVNERSIETACPSNQLPDDPFTDVDADNIFNEEITCIAEYDITTGVTATTYNPSGFVSRQQMALFISRVLVEAGETLDTRDAGFTDLPQGDAAKGFRDAINGLANAGVVRGTTTTTFSPRDDVRRDQMASFIANAQTALGRDVSTTTDYFTDDTGNTHESKINVIAEEGITAGVGGETATVRAYGPERNVTREQMAAFLSRKLDILVDEGLIEPRFTQGPADVTVDQEQVEAGDPITGEVTGANVESATVSGDCVGDDVALEDTDTEEPGIQFSVDTLEAAAPGDCELTFVVEFSNSNRKQRFERTVEITEPTTTTSATALVQGVAAGANQLAGSAAGFLAGLL